MPGLGAVLHTLRADPLRAALTMFGVTWGTASVIFLLSWGLGIQRMLDDGLTKMGKNAFFVYAGRIGEQFTPATDRRLLWFTQEDVEVLRRRARLPDIVTPECQTWMRAMHGQTSLNLDVRGIEPEMLALRDVRVGAGRSLSRADLAQRRRVVLLGQTARRRLLGTQRALGTRVRLQGQTFEVIGLLDRVGTQLSRDTSELDEQAWIPLSTFQSLRDHGDREEWIDEIAVRVPDRELYPRASDEVRAILAERLGVSYDDEEAVRIGSTIDALEQLPVGETGVVLFILAFGTLAIGGVGILAMMLDAVQERRSEIGVRLAVGGRPRDVLVQFFFETFAVTALGGALGLAFGVGACWVLSLFEAPDLIPLPILRGWIVWLALGVMLVVGTVSGLIPAWRATRVDPAESLRFE